MQKISSKISLFLIFVGMLCGFSTNAQQIESELAVGDSLFEAKKYTEAFTHYDQILASGQYTSQMLLKMAYVKEALNDITQTLYYLNLYYQANPKTEVLHKMEELADTHDLRGYDFTDYEYFATIYHKNQLAISLVGTFLLLLGVAGIFWQKRKEADILFPSVLVGMYCLVFLAAINFGFPLENGIISQDGVLLMQAPSAGASVAEKINGGHRVKILEKQDIWYKVEWEEDEVFVRENNLLIIK